MLKVFFLFIYFLHEKSLGDVGLSQPMNNRIKVIGITCFNQTETSDLLSCTIGAITTPQV